MLFEGVDDVAIAVDVVVAFAVDCDEEDDNDVGGVLLLLVGIIDITASLTTFVSVPMYWSSCLTTK